MYVSLMIASAIMVEPIPDANAKKERGLRTPIAIRIAISANAGIHIRNPIGAMHPTMKRTPAAHQGRNLTHQMNLLPELYSLDVALQRQLEEAGSERLELVPVAGDDEAVFAFLSRLREVPALGQVPLDRPGYRVARP